MSPSRQGNPTKTVVRKRGQTKTMEVISPRESAKIVAGKKINRKKQRRRFPGKTYGRN